MVVLLLKKPKGSSFTELEDTGILECDTVGVGTGAVVVGDSTVPVEKSISS